MVKMSRSTASNPGRRSLIGLDIRGMVVALHLEDHGLAVPDVDDAGVFARTADDLRSRRRKGPFSHFFDDL